MILYPEETSWNTLRFDKRNYTIQKAKEQQKEIIKKIPEQYVFIDDRCFKNAGRIKEVILSPQCKIIGKQAFESCQFRKGIDFPATLIEIKKRLKTAGLSLSDTGFTISSSPLREIRVTHIFLQRKHFVYSFSQKNDLSLAN